jgi:hypothetical protein
LALSTVTKIVPSLAPNPAIGTSQKVTQDINVWHRKKYGVEYVFIYQYLSNWLKKMNDWLVKMEYG